MRKKIVTVLLTAVVAASTVLGGCGEVEETGGREYMELDKMYYIFFRVRSRYRYYQD